MIPFANHLWQSTLFAVAAILLSLFFGRNRAQARYWVWFVASLKFLIPISPLIEAGRRFDWGSAAAVPPPVSHAIEQISQPFTFSVTTFAAPAATSAFSWTSLLLAVWFCGCAAILAVWGMRWRRIRNGMRAATLLSLQAPIPVMSSPTLLEPGVFGIFRPVLLLPDGITGRLTPAQLQTILAHELCHVRRRDNLAAAIHMVVEAVFWFHPLVWWIGARLVAERERACDEEVLRQGSEPYVYAEGILNVCKFYVESPIACASGVTGSHLKKRIEHIMANRVSLRLTFARKLLLATAGIAAVAGPVVIGMVNAPQSRAQTADVKFEVASIKPPAAAAKAEGSVGIARLPGGGLNAHGVNLRFLILYAYDIQDFQLSGGPGWITSERYDIVAKPEKFEGPADASQATNAQLRTSYSLLKQRLRALLAERFQLAVHKDMKELPTYTLVLAKGGSKLKESKPDAPGTGVRRDRGLIVGGAAPLDFLIHTLSGIVGRPVVNQTGLTGKYDFELRFTEEPGIGSGGAGLKPDAPPVEGQQGAEFSAPSIFTAIQAQLGLKLEAAKGPVDFIVIDRVEKPSAN